MKVFSIVAGSLVSNQENLFLRQLSKLLVIGFEDNDSFNFVAWYLNGEQVPAKLYLATA